MTKKKKWILTGIIACAVVLIISAIIFFPMLKIIIGTQTLSGDQEKIPNIKSKGYIPLIKGASDWPSWLGPDGKKISNITGIRKDWSNGIKKMWEINYLCQGKNSASWSAPVIQGNRLVIGGRDSKNDIIFCLNPIDGNLIWYGSYKAECKRTQHGTGMRATPVIEDDRVYTYGRAGDLVCWNLLDGKKIWHVNVADLGGEEPQWGHSSSPLIWKDYVIVQGGGSVRTIAFDKITGEIAWKSGTGFSSYAAIRLMNISDIPAILSFHGEGLSAINAENGDELWYAKWITLNDVNATTPVITDDKIFITSNYMRGGALLKAGVDKAEIIWENKAIASHHSDSYIIKGYIYSYTGSSAQNIGSFKCVNLDNGDVKWSTDDIGWGTCLLIDGHLLCLDIKGNMFLVKPDPEKFIKVTEMRKALGNIGGGPVWTMPIIANGYLYLRFKQRLVCYDLINE